MHQRAIEFGDVRHPATPCLDSRAEAAAEEDDGGVEAITAPGRSLLGHRASVHAAHGAPHLQRNFKEKLRQLKRTMNERFAQRQRFEFNDPNMEANAPTRTPRTRRTSDEEHAEEAEEGGDGSGRRPRRIGRSGTKRSLGGDSSQAEQVDVARDPRGHMDEEEFTLLRAFTKFDEDNSQTLDQAEILPCLHEFGLRWKNEAERKEVRDVLWGLDKLEVSFSEFATVVVVQVRERLLKLRRPRFLAIFKEVDVNDTGTVTLEESVNALRRLGIAVSDEVCRESYYICMRRMGKKDKGDKGDQGDAGGSKDGAQETINLDQEEFIALVPIVQERNDRAATEEFERIAKMHGISQQEMEKYKFDLVNFHKQFHEYDPCSGKWGNETGFLDQAQVLTVLRESGYMPKKCDKQATLLNMVKEATQARGTIGFPEFLKIMEQCVEWDRERLRKAFDLHKFHNTGMVTRAELADLLADCGIVPATAHEQEEVTALAEESDSEGFKSLLREEFVVLCQRIHSKLRSMQQERERQYVASAGWTEAHYTEFRSAFQIFDEDMSEVLEREELLKAVELLRGHYWQSSANINLMLVALGIDPHKEIKVNFLTFLRMLRMLEEGEVRRQQGMAVGFGRDRTDRLFSAFQSLQPESMGYVKRERLERALEGVSPDRSRWLGKAQYADVIRAMVQEVGQAPQVEFPTFLRIMKTIENAIEHDFDECVDDVLGGLDLGGKDFLKDKKP